MRMLSVFTRRVRQLNMLVSPPPQLRRAHERFEVKVPVNIRLTLESDAVAHVAIDVSWGGMFVTPAVASDIGETVYVTVGDFLANAGAKVMMHRAEGTAIRFDSAAEGAALTTWLLRVTETRPITE